MSTTPKFLGPSETFLVSFHDPVLSSNRRALAQVENWLRAYSTESEGAIQSITWVFINGKRALEVEVAKEEVHDIVRGVSDILERIACSQGKIILVPQNLVNQFSKPLDFRRLRC